MAQKTTGVLAATGAYILWGLLPVYWKLINQVPAHEILAHRIVWSFLFMIGLVVATNRVRTMIGEIKQHLSSTRNKVNLVGCALLITVNWLIYIWAVNDNRIVETSFGYYINPLVSVLLGVTVMKEKLTFWQSVAVFFATMGVLNMAFYVGTIPWVAIALAVSFGLYGLFKKVLNLGAVAGITMETLLVTPLALAYLAFLGQQGSSSLSLDALGTLALLAGTGVITAIPLLLFSYGTNRLPLTVLGFIQYLSPSIALLIGVVVYHEPFTAVHLISFGLIWFALLIFSLAQTGYLARLEMLLFRRISKESQV
jgi:chloramphenicol-sensitive protein RarD